MLRTTRRSSIHRPFLLLSLGAFGVAPGALSCADPESGEHVGNASRAVVTDVVINEVESSGGVPGDWVELVNATAAPIDISGYKLLDNDDTHVPYVIPAGTTLPAGAFLVIEEAQFGFGLGGADSVRLFDPASTLVDSTTWTVHAQTTYGRCADGTGSFVTTISGTKGTANACPVRLNEIESNGGVPGDWVELVNAGPASVDISGYKFLDNDNAHIAYVVPSGTILLAGAYMTLEEAQFGFGLGGADSARLFDAQDGLIDSYSWTVHAAVTYGRCPDATGAFSGSTTATKAATNDCPPPPVLPPWPGNNQVQTVDGVSVFGGNLSDLFYEPAAGGAPNYVWAVRNGPSTLFRLEFAGGIWAPTASFTVLYPDGSGQPDGEGVTRAELGSPAMYVATERDNANGAVARYSVLRYDTSQPGPNLTATNEWNLTADLPAPGSNLGLEGITWIPDAFLVKNDFFDEVLNKAYDPADHANHGTGLFFLSLENSGMIYAYALDHTSNAFQRVATIDSGFAVGKTVYFDREMSYLWNDCGIACNNATSVLSMDTTGRFKVLQKYAAPTTMPNITNEGIAIAPESQCVGGMKPFYWTDDAETSSHSLRADTIPCGRFIVDPNDTDNDGVQNAADDCPANADPAQVDSDGDGFGDACDLCPIGNNSCPAPDECHDAGTCDGATGLCSNPSKPDGAACTAGTCQAGVCTPSTSSAGGAGGTGTGGAGVGGSGVGGSGVGGSGVGGSGVGGSGVGGAGVGGAGGGGAGVGGAGVGGATSSSGSGATTSSSSTTSSISAGGSTSDSATSSSAGGAGTAPAGGEEDDSGCGCRVAGNDTPESSRIALGSVIALVIGLVRRSRRSKRSARRGHVH